MNIEYQFGSIPACSGDYELTWTANGIIFGPTTASGSAGIVGFMNFNDGVSAWTYDAVDDAAIGANTVGSTQYSNLVVVCPATGDTTIIAPTLQVQYVQGTELFFATQGIYDVEVVNGLNCRDTQTVTLYCSTPDVVNDTINVGQAVTYCLDQSQVPAADTVINFCALASSGTVSFVINQNTACVTYTGLNPGSDIACFVVCAAGNICDTTYMFIEVLPPPTIAVDDTLVLISGQPNGTVVVCANDSFVAQNYSVSIIGQPNKGILIQQTDLCTFVYTPTRGLCGEDVFQYQLVTPWGSDIASVLVLIPCDTLIIYDAFSPNGDGLNDFMVIQGIQGVPGNEVVVYNRWGNLVLRRQEYQNDWDGTFQGRDLPDGYYYLTITDNSGVVKGQKWIRIQR